MKGLVKTQTTSKPIPTDAKTAFVATTLMVHKMTQTFLKALILTGQGFEEGVHLSMWDKLQK